MNEVKKFAKGLSFRKLFLIFLIGSVFGAYYEEVLSAIKIFFKTGDIIWSYRRGVIYGPFSPIYGAGLLLFTVLLADRKLSKFYVFLYSSIIGGCFEYMISFLQETFLGTVSWDYSKQFLNIHGRTTIPIMIFWGIAGMLYICYIYPKISNIIEKIPYHFGIIFTDILFIFIILDMLISWTALGRQTLRRKNIEPFTIIGEVYDHVYTDEYLKRFFPNMVSTKE